MDLEGRDNLEYFCPVGGLLWEELLAVEGEMVIGATVRCYHCCYVSRLCSKYRMTRFGCTQILEEWVVT